jgi:S-DNA-T family DNA segregation ATPase FtsK/SpoIIIE
MSLHHHQIRHHGRDLEVTSADPDATVADVVSALAPGSLPGPLWVAGQRVGPATPLDRAGIHRGAELRTIPPAAAGAGHPPGGLATVRLRFTTGADTGRLLDLPPGSHLIGRRPPGPGLVVRDRTVSAVHARLDVTAGPVPSVTVTDLGSTNGTLVDGRPTTGGEPLPPGSCLALGAALALVEAVPEPGGREAPRWPAGAHQDTVPRHRTGRVDVAPEPDVARLPDPPDRVPAVTPVGLVALAASAAGATLMVVVLGSWRYAAFALLGPVSMLAHSLDSRRRRRTGRRRHQRRLRREVGRLAHDLTAAAATERRRRAVHFADPFAPAVRLDPGSATCWERRLHHRDALEVRVGHGAGPWHPTVSGDPDGADPLVRDLLARHRTIADTAIGLRLESGRPIAVVGPPDLARGLARTIVLAAATAHGPADLAVAGLWREPGGDWDWLAWLPHVIDVDGTPLLAADGQGQAALELVDRLGPQPGRTAPPVTVVVIDDADGLGDRRSPARTLLRVAEAGQGAVAVVVLPTGAAVPAACDPVLRVDVDGRLHGPPAVTAGAAVVAATPVEVAAAHARRLARFDDPEVHQPGRHLPAEVRLRDLLGLVHPTAATIRARWRAGGPDPAPTATLGLAADGPVRVDLAADGPHVLVAGTTGAGKSELLRSLVLSLAIANSPDHLAFVLVDFKGGSAFDACARLPHTAGLVTDLDEHLAARALRCLEAELRERERRLRALGAGDLAELRRLAPAGPPLPRLVVVVDEFAALSAAVPDFVDALVDVAQRGRSLGVHLVLATQRPSGAVSPAIQANVGLRICLRVQATQDSADVLDAPDAAGLPRRVPGRALVKLGPDELIPTQVAIASRAASSGTGVRVRPLGAPRRPGPGGHHARPSSAAPPDPTDRSDLELLVDLVADAWQLVGGSPPRCPWPDPLPDRVPWPVPGRADDPGHLVIGLADDPDHQRLAPFSWDVGRGPLLSLGLPGAGGGTLAATVVLEATRAWANDPPRIHIIDAGPGDLAALAGLGTVGAVVTGHEHERQRRLLELLARDLARRQAAPHVGTPRRILVVHGLSALRARWDDRGDAVPWARLSELVAGGAGCGIHLCLTSEGTVPHQVLAACEQRLLFRLGDPADVAAHGIASRSVPALPADRGVTLAAGVATVVHVARPDAGLAAAVASLAGRTPDRSAPVEWVGVLPPVITHHDLVRHLRERGERADRPTSGPTAEPDGPTTPTTPTTPTGPTGSTGPVADGRLVLADDRLVLALGLADHQLDLAALHLPPGGHALISGPPRSGRTTALARLAGAAAASSPVIWVAPAGSPAPPLPAGVAVITAGDHGRLADALEHRGRLLVLVDDADRVDDDHPALTALVADRQPGRHVVAAARNDRLRGRFGPWTREVRADGTGLLLVPDLDLDGDLLGTRLPRRPSVELVRGRGWLTGPDQPRHGFVQVALPRPPAPGSR